MRQPLGTVTGRIHNIVSGGKSVSDDIYLDRVGGEASNISSGGVISQGRARMGAAVTDPLTGNASYPYNGVWSGRFYNAAPPTPANQAPLSAAGTFGVQQTDKMGTTATTDDVTSSFIGSFGAHKQ